MGILKNMFVNLYMVAMETSSHANENIPSKLLPDNF